MQTQRNDQVYFSVSGIAKKSDLSRSYIYVLNRKYGFIRKLGSRSLIKWSDFEDALSKEFRPLT